MIRLGALSLLCILTLSAAPRQKIGLVLEGGGALGFAHIGVLDWLEKNHIPIDAIAGTSMGGLVGGLYAAGKSPQQIRDLVENQIDWAPVLRGQPDFQDLSYRRKEDRLAYPNRLDFGLRHGFGGPSGLNAGQQVDDIINSALLPYFELRSFDDLPIPFRCVATDMNTGVQKIFDHGSLAHALRATMSIPAIFSPAQFDGVTYTDGGALNNLPVDIAKRMGVDIVIAVLLDTGPPDPKALRSAIGVAGRTISIMITANEKHNIEMADIVLTADLKGFTSADFTSSAAIIPKGHEAAERKRAILSNLKIPEDDWNQYITTRNARRRTDVPVPEFVEVTATAKVPKDFASLAGKPVDPDEIQRRMDLLIGQGLYSNIDYSLVRQNGRTGLLFTAREKSYGPPFLQLGVVLDGTDPNDVRFGLSSRLTFLNLKNRAEWRTDVAFATTYGINTEYYQPIGNGNWFVAPRAYITKSRFDVYQSGSRIASYSVHRGGGGTDVGYRFGRRAEMRAGYDISDLGAVLKIGLPLQGAGARTLGDTSVRFQYLGQDDVMLPRKGVIQQSRFDWYNSSQKSFAAAQMQFSYFHPVSTKGSLILSTLGGSAFSEKNLGLLSFSLGGPLRLGAYGVNELLGNQFFLIQSGYSHQIGSLNPLLGEEVYVIGLAEVGKIYGNLQAPTLPVDGSVAVVAKTALGPIFIGGSVTGSRVKWWFGVGRVF